MEQQIGFRCNGSNCRNLVMSNNNNLCYDCYLNNLWHSEYNNQEYLYNFFEREKIKHKSRREDRCREALINLGIKTFIEEYILYVINHGRYSDRYGDFFSIYDNRFNTLQYNFCKLFVKFVVEVDGDHHFNPRSKYFKLSIRESDIAKTEYFIANGIMVIRIVTIDRDDDDVVEAEYHIMKALKLNKPLYLSRPHKYPWLTSRLNCDYNKEDKEECSKWKLLEPKKLI